MSTSGTGCTTTCAQPAGAARPLPAEAPRLLAVALLGAFAAGTLVATVATVASTGSAPLAAPAAASETASHLARRDLVGELSRSKIDLGRIASLAANAGMSDEETIGALRLARHAAIGGRAVDKARDLGAVISQLRPGETGR